MFEIAPRTLAVLSNHRHVIHDHDTATISPKERMQQCGALGGVPALWTWDTAIPHMYNSMRQAVHCNESEATPSKSVIASVNTSRAITPENKPMHIKVIIRAVGEENAITGSLHCRVIHSKWADRRLEVWNAPKPEGGKIIDCCLRL